MAVEQSKLTIKQALAEGYTLCGEDGLEWQSLMHIEELTDDEIVETNSRGKRLVLASKEPKVHMTSPKNLMDQAIDDYYNNDDFSNDDTGEIDHAIRANQELFEEFATKLNEIYATKKVWLLTKIELIPNGD